MNKDIEKAIEILKKGGIVIFPTDTAFGIGCVIDNEKAVERLFTIRKRPVTQATPVLVDTVKMAQDYLKKIPQEVIANLIEPYWPGALTIVLSCKTEKVPELVRGGGNTIGVRIPNHPVARAIIAGVGKPVLGPSANFHGEKTPFLFEDLDKDLLRLVDYVVPGKTNEKKQASTVIDCSMKTWKILREGAVRIKNYELRINDKKEVIIFIDTSSNAEIVVSLKINDQEDAIRRKIGKQKAQEVLPIIDQLLKKHTLQKEDISEIKVHKGPGSFTGLRVGIAIANTLAFSLQIPVNGKKPMHFVTPHYS